MASAHTGIKNVIESWCHIANISKVINMPIKYAKYARISVFDFKKLSKPYEYCSVILSVSGLANDLVVFRDDPRI